MLVLFIVIGIPNVLFSWYWLAKDPGSMFLDRSAIQYIHRCSFCATDLLCKDRHNVRKCQQLLKVGISCLNLAVYMHGFVTHDIFPVADRDGRQGRIYPPPVRISFACNFRQKICKIIGWRAPLSTGKSRIRHCFLQSIRMQMFFFFKWFVNCGVGGGITKTSTVAKRHVVANRDSIAWTKHTDSGK